MKRALRICLRQVNILDGFFPAAHQDFASFFSMNELSLGARFQVNVRELGAAHPILSHRCAYTRASIYRKHCVISSFRPSKRLHFTLRPCQLARRAGKQEKIRAKLRPCGHPWECFEVCVHPGQQACLFSVVAWYLTTVR